MTSRAILNSASLLLSLSLCAACEQTDGSTTMLCSDTCPTSGDAECDDGGEGSLFNICALGTDCTDCGPRVAPAGDAGERFDSGGGCACDLDAGTCDDTSCTCDPDCAPGCSCDVGPGCDVGCACDSECTSTCECAGNVQGVEYRLACGESTPCSLPPDAVCPDGAEAFQVTCSASGNASTAACTLTTVAMCGACTSSDQCACESDGAGSRFAAACYGGRCRTNCGPSSTDYVEATPDDGSTHGRGYCSSDGC